MELSERDSTKIRDIARGYDVLCQDTIQIDELLNAAVPKAIELKGLSKEEFNLQINQFQQRGDLSVRAFEEFLEEVHLKQDKSFRVNFFTALEQNVQLNLEERVLINSLYHNYAEIQEDNLPCEELVLDAQQVELLGNGVFKQTVEQDECEGSMYLAQWMHYHQKMKQEKGTIELANHLSRVKETLPLTLNECLVVEQLFCIVQEHFQHPADVSQQLQPPWVQKLMGWQHKVNSYYPTLQTALNKEGEPLYSEGSPLTLNELENYYLKLKHDQGPQRLMMTLEGIIQQVPPEVVEKAYDASGFPQHKRGSGTCGMQRGCRSACCVM